MRIVFAGTPTAAIPTLEALTASDHEVVAVLTRPPARRGRGRTLYDSSVGEWAKQSGLPVIETSQPNAKEVLDRLRAFSPDLGVVVAYGALLGQDLLELPRMGWINLHFSDLPRWRGAAPVQHAIKAGDEDTAISVFQLEKGLDTGPVFAREKITLSGDETTGSLLKSLSKTGANLICEVVGQIANGRAHATAQDEGEAGSLVTYASQLSKQDGFVDFTDDCAVVDALIRAVTPEPGAWTRLPDGRSFKLGPVIALPDADDLAPGVIDADKHQVRVGCAHGAVVLGKVAPPGKAMMAASDWWRGARLASGNILGKDLQ